jgi:hypothetical protein
VATSRSSRQGKAISWRAWWPSDEDYLGLDHSALELSGSTQNIYGQNWNYVIVLLNMMKEPPSPSPLSFFLFFRPSFPLPLEFLWERSTNWEICVRTQDFTARMVALTTSCPPGFDLWWAACDSRFVLRVLPLSPFVLVSIHHFESVLTRSFYLRWTRTWVDIFHRRISSKSSRVHRSGRIKL